MSVHILAVDDEPDVEALFRHVRRSALERGAAGLLTRPIDFAQRQEIDLHLGQVA